MSFELDALKDMTRALRRRVELSDSSDWLPAAAREPEPARAATAAVLFVGEKLGDEDGRLFDKILEAIGLSRATVALADVAELPGGALDARIRDVSPRFLVTLGGAAARLLLGDDAPIAKLRGAWREYDPGQGAPRVRLLPTLHPSALVRDPGLKRDVWTDMKNLREELSKS